MARFVAIIGQACILALAAACPGSGALGAPLPLRRIADGVYEFQGAIALMDRANHGAIANLGVVIGSKGCAVIDTGGSVREGRDLLSAIRKISSKPILYVINTHVHPDHIFGNAAFLGLGATFVGHANLPRTMAAQGPYYLKSFLPAMGHALLADVRLVPPTLLVKNRLTLDLGGRKLALKTWAASHTDTDITIEDEKTRVLFAGDLLFVEHIPVIDNSLDGFILDTKRLQKQDARLVVPGHGPIPGDWHQAVAAERHYFDVLKADITASLHKGLTMRATVHDAGASEAGSWKLFNDYNKRNATTAYAELEWN
ncbi:MAG: quinoprotein relay system zinc metallohydrolase 2 [Hyphomicrobiales bacterium]|nr:quinoprotein relay system zinc metallohydrolase 2 [Hyphomicrobiales bacterium]